MHSEKVSCQSSLPRGLLELMMEAKKIDIRYIFDLKSHVIAKRGNCSKEIAGR